MPAMKIARLSRLSAPAAWLAAALAGPALAAPEPATISAIQGRGAASPLVGRLVATQGAITRVEADGFFLQDAGDGDAATSDALFVYTHDAPDARAGDCVRVSGRVASFDAAGERRITELHAPRTTPMPAGRCAVAPVELGWPLAAGDDGARLEGMLVRLRGPLVVQQNFFLGRSGQLTLAAGGRIEAPTNRLRPGAQALALAAADARRRIVLDDGDTRGPPVPAPFVGADGTVRAGDHVDAVTGVLAWGRTGGAPARGGWRLLPTQPLRFARANPRPAAPPAVGGNLRVAAMNVDNFFSTVADGSGRCGPRHVASDCRGARSPAEFERQRAKLAATLVALDADVVALAEVENNGPVALQSLVDALDARAGRGTYARIDDPAGGAGGDAIKVALLYKPARVRPLGPASADDAAVHNRRPVAQAFERLGGGAAARFNVVAVHFKSRRCEGAAGEEAEQGDLQGCWSRRRVLQARALREFVQRVQAASGVARTLVVGDFNAYAHEDPVAELAAHGFADLLARFDPDGYSFVFDGAAGRLDEALATPALAARVTGAAPWHVNADEPALLDAAHAGAGDAASPYRSSDHDPLLIGLDLP
jgi:predicted extracellular nuclease